MNRFVVLLLCIVVFATGCTSSRKKLTDYPVVTTIFSEQEVADLQILLDLFEQEIGIRPDASPEAKAAGYSVFNMQVLASMKKGNFSNYPLSHEQKNKLFDVLHVGTFRSIWSLGAGSYPDKDGEKVPVIFIGIHTEGKFVDFLTQLGKEYPQFIELHDELKMAGDISPSFALKLFSEVGDFNLQDVRIRLVYMVCCLRGEWINRTKS